MIEALFWWDEAAKLKEQARATGDAAQRAELLELAETCEAIAINVEDRATGG
jgi:hypothetical protein